jgi:PAS domain S-box-containing protein
MHGAQQAPVTGATDDLLFRELVEEAPAIVFAARPDGSIAYINRAWTAMSGHAAGVVLAGGWADVVHPDDAARVGTSWERAMACAVPFREEFRIRDGAGDPRWVVSQAVPVFDPAGDVKAWYGTVFDVDARHTAETALRSLSDAIPHLVWINDAHGNAIHVNSRWLEYTGLDVGASLGQGWTAAVHPDDVESATQLWIEALASGRFESTRPYRLRRHDGVYRWFVTHAVAMRDEAGAIVRWYGTNTDVDDQYRSVQRRTILARLGAAFVESLDFVRTARSVVTTLCEDFADFAFVDVRGEGDRLERIALETGRLHADPKPFATFVPPPEAQHPIAVVLSTGVPQVVPNFDAAFIDANSWSAEHAAFAKSLPIASIAYVPMIAAGERIGVLTVGTARGTGRLFGNADLDDLEEVGRRAAVALANARLYANLAASEERYRNLIETAEEGVWILDADGITRYANRRLCEMLGYTADEMYGRAPVEFTHDDERDRSLRDYARHRRSRAGLRTERKLLRKDGSIVWAILSASPMLGSDGTFDGTLAMLTDITDRKAIETQYRLLAEATPQIVWTADPHGMMTFLNERWTALTGITRDDALGYGWTRVVHPDDLARLLDGWGAARENGDDFEAECRLLRDGDATYRWQLVRARARRDEAGAVAEWLGSMTDIDATRRLAKVREVVARAGDVLSRELDVDGMLDGFAALLVDELADEVTIRLPGGRAFARSRTTPPDDAPSLRATLRHRDAELGTILLRNHAPFEADEAALLEELAARAGVAIENALLYEREHRVAVTLQRALLPAELPALEGLTFDAVYFPGGSDAEIGGDWYDAIGLPDGRVLVSIGDVTGRGLTAAVIMGRMRQALDTLATYESDPVRLLDSADAVLRRAHPDAIVTALVGVIDPATGTMTYATAGHPTPFVRATDGTIRRLPGRGLPLGLREGHHQPATTIVLPPASLTVFFTDGLTEATRDIEEGESRVIAALDDPSVADGRAPAAALVARVLDDAIRDDVAVLTVRVSGAIDAGDAWTIRWSFDARESARAHDVRDAFVETLSQFAADVDLGAAQVVFAELVGNAVRHAPGTIDVVVRSNDPAGLVIEVIDDGPGFPVPGALPAAESESGRGLYLVSQLTDGFEAGLAPGRGGRARAVLRKRTEGDRS